MNSWIYRLIPFAVLAVMVVLRIFDPAPVERARWLVFDSYQRVEPRAFDPQLPVRIVDIDDASLERYGQWPWPRTLVAELLRRLAVMGAGSIAFDMVFAEPDRTSPEQVLAHWQAGANAEALRSIVEGMPTNDEVFAQMIAATPTVAGFVLTQKEGARLPQEKGTFAFGGDDPRRFVPAYSGAVVNLPELEAPATGNGALNIVPDHDQIIRRVPLALQAGNKLFPSLAMEAIRVGLRSESYLIKSSGASGVVSFGEHTGVNGVRVGPRYVPTTADGQMLMHYTLPHRERYVSAWEILEDKVSPDVIHGHIVLIGTSAAGLHDLRSIPVAASIPGVEVHAQAIEQILAGDFIERPDFANALEIVYIFVLGLILILLLGWIGPFWTVAAGGGAVALAIAGSWLAYSELHWMLDPLSPSVMVALVFLAATATSYFRSDVEKRQIRGAFSLYVAPAVVERLAADPSQLKLGGEVRKISVMFCDIRRFTSISEQFKNDPEGLTTLINRFLTPMTEVVLNHRGTIDKYIGDCLMSFWNAPLDDEEHAIHACRAALAQQEALHKLNGELATEAAGGEPVTSELKANYTLAKRYSYGAGVRRDDDMAFEMFTAQAARGYANAQYSLAKAYRDGVGVLRDDGEATRWFRAAAQQGYAKAQYQLGLRYHRGQGIEPDPVTAMTWLSLAARAGLDEAEQFRRDLLKTMTRQDLDRAEHRARGWRPESTGGRAVHLEMGIGISTGECLVGNLGSLQRFDYSALGDPVNQASRLEGQTKNYGVPIIIAESTQALATGFAAIELDFIAVVGKREPVRIFALMGDEHLAASGEFRKLTSVCTEMLSAYRQQRWTDARDLLNAVEEADGYDSLEYFRQLYRGRIKELERNPPGADWDGIFVSLTK